MSRISTRALSPALSTSWPALAAFAAACASSSPSSPAPTGTPPVRGQPAADLKAVSLGVAVVARDDRDQPRLIRAIAPRPAGVRGMAADAAARDHLAALAPLWVADRPPAALTTHSQQRLRNGASVVRLQQQVDNIDLHQGELRVLLHADGALAAVSGTLQPAIGRVAFRSTPVAALERALDALYGPSRVRPAITEGDEHSGYRALQVAEVAGLRVRTARAKRELLPEGDLLTPIWTVELAAESLDADGETQIVARRLLIADASGQVLRDVDLISHDAFVYRALADTTGNRRPLDGAFQSYTPHPTGMPDGSLPALTEQNLVVMEAFNGPRDPWLPGDATTTAGNNVEAFADLVPPVGFDDGDIRPEVRAGRTLNYRFDFTADPLRSPTQSKAAAVNVFFATNWLHDWYYDSGFTEATGNAQADNFGRGGLANDRLIARAQADALGGSRDNAFMEVPADGASPVMHMFLWSGRRETALVAPSGSPATEVFFRGPTEFDVAGTAVLVDDTLGRGHTACVPVKPAVAGKIAVYEFTGDCNSGLSVNNLKAAGAIGVVAVIMLPGVLGTLTGSLTANLPGLVLRLEDGQALEATLPAEVTLHRSTSLAHDGDFDNGVIAHEWGHYLHQRLASCESRFTQCFAMSEGWADFIALHMMVRESDDRTGTFAAAVYALAAGGLEQFGYTDPGYFSDRRYPYSLDRTKNPLRLGHISNEHALPPEVPANPGATAFPNSEIHNAGEVWAEMLWEVYNVLIDQHGFVEAQRRMSDFVVAGMLLTPPDATYTEGRDALLAAASALDTDDMVLMAAAFAGRGAGTCAVAPARISTDFAGVVESGTLAARLETGDVVVLDDGASCDRDGILDPGESGALHLTVANNGIVAAEGVVVRATTTTPGVTLGPAIRLGDVAAFTQIDVAIPVRIAASVAPDSALDVALTVEGDAGCNTGHIVVEVHRRVGVDEVAALDTTDDFEPQQLAWTPTGPLAGDLWRRIEQPTGNHVLFGAGAAFPSDTQLVSPVLQVSATEPLVVSLTHAYNFETFDGGVVEASIDGGATWRDVTELGVDPGYPRTVDAGSETALAGRAAFSGASPAFPARAPLVLDFGTRLAGASLQLRFRIVTDVCCTVLGWEIDDIAIRGITNTPFPGFVPEPGRCTPREAARDAGGVVEVRSARRASLGGVALPAGP